MRFTKFEGAGNDFICVDRRREGAWEPAEGEVRRVCDRRFGVGGDGVVLVEAAEEGVAGMVVLNADGSRADMCGNALRCVARMLVCSGEAAAGVPFRVRTDAGLLEVCVVGHDRERSEVASSLGVPVLEREGIPMTGEGSPVLDVPLDLPGRTVTVCALRLGNPCCVVWTDDVEREDVGRWGPLLEGHPVFPRGANVAFVEVRDRSRLRQRTYERGVGRETLACGTGAGAAAVAALLTNRAEGDLTVELRGGTLAVRWEGSGGAVWATGPATTVFEGTWPWR